MTMIYTLGTDPQEYEKQLQALAADHFDPAPPLIAEALNLVVLFEDRDARQQKAYNADDDTISQLLEQLRQKDYQIQQYEGDVRQIVNAVYKILQTLGLIDPDSGQLVFRPRSFMKALTIIGATATSGGNQFAYLVDMVPLLKKYAPLIQEHPDYNAAPAADGPQSLEHGH